MWNDIEHIIALNTPEVKVSFRGVYRIIQDSYSRKFIIYGTGIEVSSLKQLLEMLDVKTAYFIDNIRIMNSICREYGIIYKAFLQPCLVAKEGELSDYGYELMLHLSFDQRGWKAFDNTRMFYKNVR